MNRRKKGNQILKARARKAKAKLAPKSNKPRYISKADRAKLVVTNETNNTELENSTVMPCQKN